MAAEAERFDLCAGCMQNEKEIKSFNVGYLVID